MSDLLTKDLVAYDPLSETTRRERRALLGLSVIAVAMVKVPVIPEKISALGIEFSLKNQQTFLSIYALVLIYFLMAFLVYALTDYISWRRARVILHQQYSRQTIASNLALGEEGGKELQKILDDEIELRYKGFANYRVAHSAARLRAIFEFVVPITTVRLKVEQNQLLSVASKIRSGLTAREGA